MIRIMHVISGLDQGGAEGMLVRLLRGLDRRSFSQSVVSLTTRGVYGDQIEAMGIPLLTLGITGFAGMPASLFVLRRAIRQQQPHVVQTWLYHADLLGLLAARMAGGAAVAWNIRCAALLPGDVPPSTRLLTKLLARLSPSVDAVLFNSTAGLEAHGALGYQPYLSQVIPNGFDLDERRPDPERRASFRSELGLAPDAFLVGMIGRAHRIKDQSTFLTAAARLKNLQRTVRFVLVGWNHTWSNTSLVAEIDKHGLRDRIFLLGPREDIPRIMAGLDCLVSTSTSEGFPNVLGEAMACGVPCVATDAGDSKLIVGDTGAILPIGDVAGIVGGVSALMTSSAEDRRIRSERCRRRVLEHFELSEVAGRYAAFYRDLNERRLARREEVAAEREPASAPADPWWTSLAGASSDVSTAPSVLTRRQKPPLEPYSSRRRWIFGGLVTMAFLYILVFHTPLVWFAGDVLTMRQQPVHADAIVVFSGNGESSYINTSYQRRAVDAARYYKAGYAPLLVISSGIEQTFAEVAIIRALLVSEGVPSSAMYIVPKYPVTTRQNVEIVNDVLKGRGARSVLFITAPYHSRRASMIWKKVAPEVTVTTVPVIDTPPATPRWDASLDDIKAISYEYLAIAYNRAKGWL
jgi:glycosyltransferase involved in cell wall biosynthesis/uncharacterized SAM-binding protein YcdF (DUF218 family)